MRKLTLPIVLLLLAIVLVGVLAACEKDEPRAAAVAAPGWVSTEAQTRLRQWFRIDERDALYTLAGDMTDSARFECFADIDYTTEEDQVICVIPANANVIDAIFFVATAFNDSGTDTINCGWDGVDPDEFVDAYDGSGTGMNRMADAADMPITDFGDIGGSDLTVVCMYDGQNGNASAGAATLIISYVVD